MTSLVKKWKGKTGQEIQDEIFSKMPAGKKLKLASELTMFCLAVQRLAGEDKSKKLLFQLANIFDKLGFDGKYMLNIRRD